MSTFKFNFSAFGKPKVKTSRNGNGKKIIERNIFGVIFITLTGDYYVVTNIGNFPLTIESYDVKGKNVFFTMELFNGKFQEIIQLKKADRNYRKYLPFCVGSIVKGTIYEIFKTNRFNISRVLELSDIKDEEVEYYKTTVRQAKNFFKTNYEEIIKCMNLQQ